MMCDSGGFCPVGFEFVTGIKAEDCACARVWEAIVRQVCGDEEDFKARWERLKIDFYGALNGLCGISGRYAEGAVVCVVWIGGGFSKAREDEREDV